MSEENIQNKKKLIPPFDAIKVAYYRGIGSEQIISPLGRMNVFIGENNAGKSIVLNLIHDYISQLCSLSEEPISLCGQEKHLRVEAGGGSFFLSLKVHLDTVSGGSLFTLKSDIQSSLRMLEKVVRSGPTDRLEAFQRVLSECLSKFERQSNEYLLTFPEFSLVNRVNNVVNAYEKTYELEESFWSYGQDIYEQWVSPLVDENQKLREEENKLKTSLAPLFEKIKLISAVRDTYPEKENKSSRLDGTGLIEELDPIIRASGLHFDNIQKRQKINHFVQQVLGKKNVKLEIVHNNTIEVNIEGKQLPLESLGTGIKEVIIIAAYCTKYDGAVICIEEPEIHLHPKLQRQLVRYLLKETNSQYFIATHSNIFIDIPEANLFRVSNDGVETHIEHLPDVIQKRGVLDDLGYLASDLLQTNYIIWVEGPSDRIYLRHWISLIDDALQEGIDYSIMFYGGALIKYLSVSDEENETINEQEFSDFIKLLQINRNMTILMDRDCPHDEEGFKPAVRRIKKELEDKDNSEAFWVTHGREVENYVDKGKIQAIIKSNHSGSYKEAPADLDQLNSHLFQYLSTGAKKRKEDSLLDADKIKLANKICEAALSLDNFYLATDLQEKVKTLVKRIKKANGIEIKDDDLPK